MKLSTEDLQHLYKGWSFLSTGGGTSLRSIKASFESFNDEKPFPEVLKIDDLSDESLICAVYTVGNSDGSHNESNIEAFREAIKEIERATGRRPDALFTGHMATVYAIEIASKLNFPILDADATGLRSVPTITADNFFIHGESTLPCIAVTSSLETIRITRCQNPLVLESIIEGLLVSTGSPNLAVCDHVISFGKGKQLLSWGSISKAIETGKRIRTVSKPEALLDGMPDYEKFRYIDKGILIASKLEKSDESSRQGTHTIENEDGTLYTISVQYQNIAVEKEGRTILSAPDSIILYSPERQLGLHNAEIELGQEVWIYGKNAEDLWRTEKGISFYNPSLLGFSAETTLL